MNRDEIPALTELPSHGRRKTKSQINKRCGQKVVSARVEKAEWRQRSVWQNGV